MKNSLTPSSLKWLKNNTSKSSIKQSKYALIEGEKIVLECMRLPYVRIYQIFATPEFVSLAKEQRISPPPDLLTTITQNDLEKISHLKSPKNVLAVIEKEMSIPDRKSKWTIALDNIQDPGNLGTIIRTCDWFGVGTVVCSKDSVSHFNQKTIQAAMGSIFRTRVLYVELDKWLAQQSQPIFLATIDGQNIHNVPSPSTGGIVVLGNESQGISEHIIAQYPQHSISIARHPHSVAESLNVSIACGILLAEFCS